MCTTACLKENRNILYHIWSQYNFLTCFQAFLLSSIDRSILHTWNNTSINLPKQLTVQPLRNCLYSFKNALLPYNFETFHKLKVNKSCFNLYRWLMVIKGSKGLHQHKNWTSHAVFQRLSSWNSNLQNECAYHTYCNNWISFSLKPLSWNFNVKYLTPTFALQLTSVLQLTSASESLLFLVIFRKQYVIITSIRKYREILSHIITVSSVLLYTDNLKILLICLMFTFHSGLNTVILAFC